MSDTMKAFIKSNMKFATAESTSYEVFNMMKKFNIHHIPVIDNGEAIGIISDRDVSFVQATGESFELTAKQIMTPSPVAVDELTTIPHAVSLMKQKRINSILIKNNEGKIAGIFTSTDALDLLSQKYQEQV